jgi:hypothetical protein
MSLSYESPNRTRAGFDSLVENIFLRSFCLLSMKVALQVSVSLSLLCVVRWWHILPDGLRPLWPRKHVVPGQAQGTCDMYK